MDLFEQILSFFWPIQPPLRSVSAPSAPAQVSEAPMSFPEAEPMFEITLADLRAIMPKLPEQKARVYVVNLVEAMKEFEINTPRRAACFLAQLAHESMQLKYMEEIASGEAYEGRKDLGNIHPGDGKRYKGRGPIQLTGRTNYQTAGRALGLDLEGTPTRAADSDVAFRIAGWFWKSRKLNELADADNFRAITKKINGGYNGLADRERYYDKAKEVLKV